MPMVALVGDIHMELIGNAPAYCYPIIALPEKPVQNNNCLSGTEFAVKKLHKSIVSELFDAIGSISHHFVVAKGWDKDHVF